MLKSIEVNELGKNRADRYVTPTVCLDLYEALEIAVAVDSYRVGESSARNRLFGIH